MSNDSTMEDNATDIEYTIAGDLWCEELCTDYGYDAQVCWPETANGTHAMARCPDTPHTKPDEYFERYCLENGKWGDSDIPTCILNHLNSPDYNPDYNCSTENHAFHEHIITTSHIVGLVWFLISWFCLILALAIFASFRSLKCNRTKIHFQLFLALLARITTDIIFRISRLLKFMPDTSYRGVDSIPYLCEGLNVLSEYFTMCAFAWMFVEGLYLNTLISSAVFGRPNFFRYYFIAWVSPSFFVASWAISMISTQPRCWPLYAIDNIYYLLLIEVPRDIIFTLNCFFLFHIIFVLVTKLKHNNSGETQVIRKAVKALFVLLPLLGVSHLLWRIEAPLCNANRTVIVIYYFGIRTLYASQGFAVAMLFCILNKEVRVSVKRKWHVWVNIMDTSKRRTSVITSASDVSSRSHATRGTGRPGSGTFDSLNRPGSTIVETNA